MPRGQKSKRRAREKRHQAQGETQSLKRAQATEAAEAEAVAAEEIPESPSSPASVSQDTSQSSPAAGTCQEPQVAPATTSRDEGVSCPGSEEGAQSQDEKSAGTSQAAPSTRSSCRDPLTRKVRIFVQFLLEKYKTKKPILQAALLKTLNRKYRKHFPEILGRACKIMEVVFGLELKEVDRSNHSYALISKMALPSDGSPSDEFGLPKSGLLMVLLGMIFTKGNRATEEEFWEFLNALGFYAGRRHLIFGEPTRFISKDFVMQKYLTYCQVPNSNPPRYEFLWGPRAHAETSKMKVLEFVAKIIGTVPSALPNLYEEALKDEEERAKVRVAARAAAAAARGPYIAKIHSCPKCRGVGRGHFAYFVLANSSQAPK
ncbi:melanoma-associated antigen B4-like [Phocoena sinus]|uniref:melanoma-associated antigen B4-like n=1 Tax=Phocoena sinus TaxID=42100 RepID=UPI0013C4F3B9|nr:melanoma-associated antigen B4-like [Phocoena sinus]